MNNSIAHSLAKNTTVMFSSQLATWASSFVLMLVLPRYLGSEEYGRLFLAISVTLIAQIFIEFGGNYFIAKEISREKEKTHLFLSNSIALRIILWMAAFAAIMLFSFSAGYSDKVILLIAILGISKLWEGSGKVIYHCFQGWEMMQYPSFAAIAERLIVTLFSVIALMLGANAVAVGCIMAASTLVNFFILTRFMERIGGYFQKPQWEAMKTILKESVPYFLYALFAVLYFRINAIMLSLMVPEKVVGWSGVAYRFFDILMFLPSIYTIAVFPILSKLWNNNNAAVYNTTQQSLRFIILSGIPISISVFIFSDRIIELFFGRAEFGPSALLLKIFAPGILLVYIDFVLGTAMFASDRQRQWTITALCAMLLNPALNYFFIPFTQAHQGNGGIGAAIATLITELFVMIMALSFLPRAILSSAKSQFLWKGIGSGAFMALTALLLQHSGIPWLLSAAISVSAYILGLVMLKTIEPEERNFIRAFLSLRSLKTIFAPSKEMKP